MQCMAEKNLFHLTKFGWTLKTLMSNKNDNVLRGNIRRSNGGCLPPCIRVLQKNIFRTTFAINIWHNAFSSNTIVARKLWMERSGEEI